MLRIEVDPDGLAGAASGHVALGDVLAGVSGDLADSASSAAADAGDPALGHGIGAAAEQFGAGLRSLHAEMQGLAVNLAAAARAYRDTDESAMPRL
jgi:hypothetical protein